MIYPTRFGGTMLGAILLGMALAVSTTCGNVRKAGPQTAGSPPSQKNIARTAKSGPASGHFFQRGWATTYHDKYHGRRTKSGKVYDRRGFTVAVPRSLWSRLKGRSLTIQRTSNGALVLVRVTDTVGPGVKNFDLSRAAWNALTRHAAPSRIPVLVSITEEP